MQTGRGQYQSRGGGRGRGGRGSFRGSSNPRPRPDYKPVPSAALVRPGASVSIVLKHDQPTGREVQGTVQDVLSSGNHPRGIKVRMTDGRVGRVQRMVDANSVAAPTSVSGDQNVDEVNGVQVRSNAAAREQEALPMRRQMVRSRDMRLDQEDEPPRTDFDLAAYIKPAKVKKGKKGALAEEALEDQPVEEQKPVVTCPVCGKFEGDEAAVNHHVASHFD
ncbi:hypothetical protein MBLNU457_g2960t2 [Dothideomycetes sp. NU457]